MRRRNKPKVVWIPSTNNNSADTALGSTWQLFTVPILAATTGGPASVSEIPLVLDGPQSNPLDPTSTLSDIEESGYRLRRIVGQIFVFMAQTTINNENLYGVTAGLMVRRMGSGGGGGSLAAAVGTQEIDPDFINNSMDPWVWRRSWILSDGPIPTTAATGLTNGYFDQRSGKGPSTNYGYNSGSLRDGPFIDQKTARIVGPEERLFLDVAAQPLIIAGTALDTSVVIFTNLRVLGSMRQNIGNRRNASR